MRGAAFFQFPVNTPVMISTHAPHARRGVTDVFLSKILFTISTHAPHARRGPTITKEEIMKINFYSRASCEARLNNGYENMGRKRFLLTDRKSVV